MWTAENRHRYNRSKLRHASDLTNDEWALVKKLIRPAKRGGNKRMVDVRQVVNGLVHSRSTGCQRASMPKDLPPRSKVSFNFLRWQHDATLARLHHALYEQCRDQAEREARPVRILMQLAPAAKKQATRPSTLRRPFGPLSRQSG